jgi:hypothetical protein
MFILNLQLFEARWGICRSITYKYRACKHLLQRIFQTLNHFSMTKTMNNNPKQKGGAPLKSKKFNKIIRVRIHSDDLQMCIIKAKSVNLKTATYIRKMAIEGKVLNIFSEEEQAAKIQLIGLVNNLNQLTKEAHTYGLVSVETDLKESLREVRGILDRYKKYTDDSQSHS